MIRFIFLISVLLFVKSSLAAKFPDDIPKCKPADLQCLPEVITKVIRMVPNGHRGLHLIPIDPLHVDEIKITQERESPVNINLMLSNTDITGLKNLVVTKVKGFDKDPTNVVFEAEATLDRVMLLGQYKIDGRVLILPITGNGKSNLTLDNLTFKIKFKTSQTYKNSKVYIQTKDFLFNFGTTRLHINFENLFNGDQALSDNMNRFLNENWKDILDELKPAINDAFSQIFNHIINTIFSKISYSDIYLD
ncbi:protein takeout-like [Phlebotomus argentipes]|uniref:protein takeout-like n=1 Tax=Phlebotomus argentipes TaxID=94469 RepID=UPI002893293C|nr:protein takeout-like [Phlebotomus argentipes]